MEALQQLAAVGLVLLLLMASLWVLRRRGFASLGLRGGTRPPRLEYLERLPLGPQHTLHLVRTGGADLLLATSPAGCALLERIPHPPSGGMQ